MIERLRCLQRSSLTLLSQQQLVCYTTMKMFLLAPTAAVGGLVMCSTKFHQSCFCFTPTRATRRYEHSYQSNILFPRKMNLRHVWNGSRSNLSNLSMSFSSSSSDGNDKEHQTISMDEGSSESTCSGSADSDKPETFATSYHSPVMWKECIDALLDCSRSQIRQQHINEEGDYDNNGTAEVRKEEPLIFVDGTIGGGGHSAALLKQLQPGDIVLGCDVDPKALETASKRLKDYVIVESSHKDGNHQESSTTQTTARCHVDHPIFIPVQSNFCDLSQTLATIVHPLTGQPILRSQTNTGDDNDSGVVDGILLDLGVSSHQIDTAERGFAFMKDGPLDMRMMGSSAGGAAYGLGGGDSGLVNGGRTGLTAADICNEFDESELQRILSVYGDEPRAKTIAKAIVKHRPLYTTGELVDAISSVTPRFAKQSKRMGRTATLARVFQSLRIVVNDEDGVLEKALSEVCPSLLRPGGRLVVLSYHSMEDRATKRIMRDGTVRKSRNHNERDIYGNYVGPAKPFKTVGKRRKATQEEIDYNPRARSATLRVAERQLSS